MILEVVKEIFEAYDKTLIDSNIGIELYNAYEKIKNKKTTVSELEDIQTLTDLRLCNKYRLCEKKGSLLYIDYRSWNKLSNISKNNIILKYEPLMLSGVCLDYLEIKADLDFIFSRSMNTAVIYIVKDFRCYKLIADKCEGYTDSLVLKSAKELREYYSYIRDNIVYMYNVKMGEGLKN